MRYPKLLIGLSDATVLLNEIAAQTNVVTIHGPVLAGDTFARLKDRERGRMMADLERPSPRILQGGRDYSIWRSGSGQGRLFGGNLAMVDSAIGTKFEIPYDGNFLFLEEVNEPRFRVDRMFTHLALRGAFSKIRALLLGEFWDQNGKAHNPSWLRKLVLELSEQSRIPVISGIPAGHGHNRVWLPIGGTCRFEAKARRLHLSALVK